MTRSLERSNEASHECAALASLLAASTMCVSLVMRCALDARRVH
jgi:hypothetical protein